MLKIPQSYFQSKEFKLVLFSFMSENIDVFGNYKGKLITKNKNHTLIFCCKIIYVKKRFPYPSILKAINTKFIDYIWIQL